MYKLAIATLTIFTSILSPINASTIDLPQCGFQIDALDSVPNGAPMNPLNMSLAVTSGFAPNINVQIEPFAGAMKDFAALASKQYDQMKLTILQQNQTGESEWMIECVGPVRGSTMHFYSRALLKAGKIYQATATAREDQWQAVGGTLREKVNSFKLL